MKMLRACIPLVAAIAVMSACGGGGGAGSTTDNVPPVTYSIMGIVSGAPQGTTVDLAGAKVASTTTNSIGFYQFTGLANGSYTVTPSRMGYAFSPASKSITISSGNSVNTDFTVTNAYAISGIVSGAPQGVSIALSGDAVTTATTDSLGYYEFPGLLNGSYTVTPSMPGYTLSPGSLPVTISSTNVTNRNFAVVFGIAGSVKTPGNAGVEGATITLVHSSGAVTTRTTDANGDYSALGLAAGTYTVSASLGGYSMNPFNQKVIVTCNVRTTDFIATAGTTYGILGTAWTDTSYTFTQPNVLMNLSGDNSGYVYTSTSGTYAFPGLLPGSYTITASSFRTDYQSVTPPGVIINADLVWDFAGSKRFIAPVVPPACLQLTGHITGPASSGATIDILYRSYTYTTTVTSDSGGNYLKSVPSGSYVITPSMNGHTFSPPRICGGDSSNPCSVSSTVTATGNFSSQ